MDVNVATQLHQGFGIFRYSETLEQCGFETPSKQICAIALFVTEALPQMRKRVPDGETAVIVWMENALQRWASKRGNGVVQCSPLLELQARVSGVVRWDLCRDFAELLNFRCGPEAYTRATWKLRNLGYTPGLLDATDITEQFVDVILPSAVRIFDPVRGSGREVAWLSTVFYRAALRSANSDRVRRNQLNALAECRPVSPSEPDISEEETRALLQLPQAMEKLDPDERVALELYFGFHGPEHTLSDISGILGSSGFRARSTIVRGLARLAVELQAYGHGLSPSEVQLMQLVFGDGIDLSVAARILNLQPNRARAIIGGIGEKFRSGLRLRTTTKLSDLAQNDLAPNNEESMASTAKVDGETLKKSHILERLQRLRGVPPFRVKDGNVEVELGQGRWYSYREVQDLAKKYATLLESSEAPLAWLSVPGKADQHQKPACVEDLGKHVWQTAGALFDLLQEENPAEFQPEHRDEQVYALYRVLSSVALTFKEELTQSMRRSGVKIFRVRLTQDKRDLGQWLQPPVIEIAPTGCSGEIDIGEAVTNACFLLDAFSGDAPSDVARVLCREIFKDTSFAFPGFIRNETSHPECVDFERLPPKLADQLEVLRRMADVRPELSVAR